MLYDTNNNIVIPINPIKIGKIGGVYGVLGWIKIISFTDKFDSIFSYNPWFIFLEFQWKLIHLDQWKLLGKRYIAKIRNISDRESAKLLVHCIIVVDVTQLPCLQGEEYYCKDLIGCMVISNNGVHLGCVLNIIETTANDVLVVKVCKKYNFYKIKECLIPFIQDKVIKKVHLDDRIIIVDWDIDF